MTPKKPTNSVEWKTFDKIVKMHQTKPNVAWIMRQTGLSRSAIERILLQAGIKGSSRPYNSTKRVLKRQAGLTTKELLESHPEPLEDGLPIPTHDYRTEPKTAPVPVSVPSYLETLWTRLSNSFPKSL